MDKINFKEKKILVTGGNGYLGKQVINRLISLNARVFSIDLNHDIEDSSFSRMNLNLLDRDKLNEVILDINPKIVIHLASILNRDRDFQLVDKFIEVNLKGTINLLNSLKSCDYENFIYSSTSEVYDIKSDEDIAIQEFDNISPNSPYSFSKYCAEKAIELYSKTYSKNFTILRLFNFFGLGMSKDFFLTELVENLLQDKDFDMTFGEQKRDYLNVEDTINGILLSTNKQAYNKIFNLCSGKGYKIKDIALYLKKITKSNSKINFGSLPYRKNEIWEMIGDNSKIRLELGFSPNLDLNNIFKIN